MKAIILTETGAVIGLGHISRCLSLATAFKDRNIETKMIISGNIDVKLPELYDFDVEYEDWIHNPSIVIDTVNDFEIIVVDSYNVPKSIINIVDKSSGLPVFIDDHNRIKYPRGFVINSTNAASNLNYFDNSNIQYLLGSQYVMLKKEYWNKPDRKASSSLENVLITLGANDIRNLTPRIIQHIQKFNHNIKINIVLTPYFENIHEIKAFTGKNCKIIKSPNTTQMKKLMSNSDFAISAGGQTVYELASRGVPAIIFVTALNQLINSKSMADLGIVLFAGKWDDPGLLAVFDKCLSDIQSQKLRDEMISNGMKYIKSDGSRNIVEKILNFLLSNEIN